MRIGLGITVVDSITGFKGTTTACTQYMNGRIQYCVQPKVDNNGLMREPQWIDEWFLEAENKSNMPLGFIVEVEKLEEMK